MSGHLQRLYRDELAFLRLQGQHFAKRHPQLARFLGESSADPDVERLLEGFAFLSARIREKVEDDFPELTFSLLNLLWPNYLRPVPSIAMIRFDPIEQAITERQTIPQNTELLARPVDGIVCPFYTTTELAVYPLRIQQITEHRSREKSTLTLRLQTLSAQPIHSIDCDALRFFLSGDDYPALTLYLWIFRYLDHIQIQPMPSSQSEDTTPGYRLPAKDLSHIGFEPEEAMLPYPKNVFDGYRIIQEFLAFPRRFYGFQLHNLAQYWPSDDTASVQIILHFQRSLPDDIKVRTHDFALYCIPAINLFDYSAEPVILSGERTQYPLVPSDNQRKCYEIFDVTRRR